MRTIKTLLITAVFTALSLGLHAQSRMTEAQKEEAKTKYQAYREKLELTDAQSIRVEAINNTFFEGLSGDPLFQ